MEAVGWPNARLPITRTHISTAGVHSLKLARDRFKMNTRKYFYSITQKAAIFCNLLLQKIGWTESIGRFKIESDWLTASLKREQGGTYSHLPFTQ